MLPGLPDGWSVKTGTLCDVAVPFPPKESPYLDTATGQYWQFEEETAKGAFTTRGEFQFKKRVRTIFKFDGEARHGGTFVDIYCLANSENYTSSSLVAKIESDLKKTNTKEYTAKINKKDTVEMWDRDAVKVTGAVTGEMSGPFEEYYIATDENIYMITKHVDNNQSQQVTDTLNEIFKNIEITN